MKYPDILLADIVTIIVTGAGLSLAKIAQLDAAIDAAKSSE